MMIITCGQCQARFKVAPEQIKVTGSKVRCSNCGYVFTVYRPGEAEGGEGPPRESPQARRERRRRLYADEAELGGPREDEDGGWDEAGLDEAAGRPPLRRRPAPPPEEPKPSPWDGTEPGPAGDPGYDPGDDLDDDLDDDPYEGRAEGRADDPVYDDDPEDDPADDSRRAAAAPPPADDPPASPPSDDDDLGLGADPARLLSEKEPPPNIGSHYGGGGGGEIRAAVSRVKNRHSGLFLGLAIFCAVLTIAIFYLSSRPEPLALSDGSLAPPPPAQAAAGPSDPRGIEHITFTPKDNLKHFYRKNQKEGELLIITGRVRNSYPTARSHIRLRGLLLDQNGNTLADRFVYAGNLISEEDLIALPKDEIMTRLNNKGGQNHQNMNIPPGREVPFMVVFDKVPPNRDEYRIIPIGSDPAE